MGSTPGQKWHDTPKRAKVRGVIELLEHFHLLGHANGQISKQQVFEFFGVSRSQGFIIIKSRIEDKSLQHHLVHDVPKELLGSDIDARTLKNDPRFPTAFQREGSASKLDKTIEKPNGDDPQLHDGQEDASLRLAQLPRGRKSGQQRRDRKTKKRKSRA